MFKNLASIVIKFKGTIEIIPIKTSSVKNIKPKYNNPTTITRVVECNDEYIKRIIKNGGL